GQSAVSTRPLGFEWNCPLTGPEFSLEIQAHGGSIRTIQTAANTWLETLEAGDYRWRVRATYHGNAVAETERRDLTVADGEGILLTGPADGQAFRFWRAPEPFDFSWQPKTSIALNASQYEIQISSDPRFDQILKTAKTPIPKISSSNLTLVPDT